MLPARGGQRENRFVAKSRVPVPADLVADAMFESDSTCCVCRERGKAVQTHHVDEEPSHNTLDNLAVLCLECHDRTQMSGGFGRKLNDVLVRKYRAEWLLRVRQRRDAADRAVVERMVGPMVEPAKAPGRGAGEKLPYSKEHADTILTYVNALPALRVRLRRRAEAVWQSGSTADVVEASYDYIDALQEVLVTLAGFYAPGSFDGDPRRFFGQMISSRFRWHREHSEPSGPGTGGTIVNIVCSRGVVDDVEEMVEEVAQSLVGYDDRFDWRNWPSRWRAEVSDAK